MTRVFRKLFRMHPVIQETPEQRETRERLEFFRSLPVSEQRRLLEFFASVFTDCDAGVHEFQVEQVKAIAA